MGVEVGKEVVRNCKNDVILERLSTGKFPLEVIFEARKKLTGSDKASKIIVELVKQLEIKHYMERKFNIHSELVVGKKNELQNMKAGYVQAWEPKVKLETYETIWTSLLDEKSKR